MNISDKLSNQNSTTREQESRIDRRGRGVLRKKRLVVSPKPFTDWVENGAKEEEWQEFLRNQEEKECRKARRIRDKLLRQLDDSGVKWEELFEKPVYWAH